MSHLSIINSFLEVTIFCCLSCHRKQIDYKKRQCTRSGITERFSNSLNHKIIKCKGSRTKYRELIWDSSVWLYFRFSTKESATHAIVAVHNTDINGQTVKCSWGKESGDPNNAQQTGQVNVRSFIDLSWKEGAIKFATEFWIKFGTRA